MKFSNTGPPMTPSAPPSESSPSPTARDIHLEIVRWIEHRRIEPPFSRTGEDLALPWGQEGWDYLTSSPAVANGVAYWGSGDGHVYAVDAEAGGELWRFATGGRVRSTPAVVDGGVPALGPHELEPHELEPLEQADLGRSARPLG